MADDTRQKENVDKKDIALKDFNAHPENKPFSGQQWDEVFKRGGNNNSNGSANLMAGGTQNTAGGRIPEVSITEAFDGGLKWKDFADLPKRPCVRDSYLTGIGSGFALGGVRAVWGASLFSACSWAVFSTCAGASLMYQYCLYKRQAEKDGMMRAMDIVNKKQLEKEAREAAKEKQKEERRRLKEEELDNHYAKLKESKPWWKFW